MYGVRCTFRHEHATFKQLHRHHYTPHLFAFETFYFSAQSKAAFFKLYRPSTRILPVFEQIHAMNDLVEEEETESELSDIEMSTEMI